MEEYLKDFNATRTYKVVHGNRMTEKSAGAMACEHLKNVRVMAEIDRRLTKLFVKLEVSNATYPENKQRRSRSDIMGIFPMLCISHLSDVLVKSA